MKRGRCLHKQRGAEVSLLRTYLKPHWLKMSLNAEREYMNWHVNSMKEKRG
jgi:hypothetical protein